MSPVSQLAQIDALIHRFAALKQAYGLKDRRLVQAVQDAISGEELAEDATVEQRDVYDAAGRLAWWLFVRAPVLEPRFLALAPMQLDLILNGERTFEQLLEELRGMEAGLNGVAGDVPAGEEAWAAALRPFAEGEGIGELSGESLEALLTEVREIRMEHREALRQATTQWIGRMLEEFQTMAEQGGLREHAEAAHGGAAEPEAMPEAMDYFDEGREHYEACELDAALLCYSKALERDPEMVAAWIERGITRAALEDIAGGVADLDEALAREPRNYNALVQRAMAWHALGEMVRAVADYDAALALSPVQAELWVNAGIARFALGLYEDAQTCLNRSLDLDPTNPAAFLHRAQLWRMMGRLDFALEDFGRALHSSPNMVEAWAGRGFLYLELEEYERAVADFTQAIAFAPGDPQHYYNRGNAHAGAGDMAAAMADYTSALEREPEDIESLCNRGAAHMNQGQLTQALADWNRAIEINPYYHAPYVKRSALWLASAQKQEAVQDMGLALEYAPADWPYRAELEAMRRDLLAELGFGTPN